MFLFFHMPLSSHHSQWLYKNLFHKETDLTAKFSYISNDYLYLNKVNKSLTTAESVQGPNIPPSPKTGSKKGMMNNNIAEDIGAW